MVCEYGCWAFSVFAGEGDATPDNCRFQSAAVKAGVIRVLAKTVDLHLESASVRRHVYAGSCECVLVSDQSSLGSCKVFLWIV